MLYVRHLVQAPSIAPLVSASGGGLWVAHRRVNQSDRVTVISPIEEDATLPATVTPESYGVPADLNTDEILASNDNGATWYRSPTSTAGTKGAQSVPAFSTATWSPVTLGDTQKVALLTLDLGSFTGVSEPFQDFWLLNDTESAYSSLSYEVVGVGTSTATTILDSRLSLSILGIFNPDTAGVGSLATSQNTTLNYQSPPRSLNSTALNLTPGFAVKLRVSLQNFPATGLEDTLISASIQITPNRSIFPAYTFDSWLNGAVWYNETFKTPWVANGSGANLITLNPVAIKVGGAIAVNWATRSLTLAAGTWRLEATPTGRFVFVTQATPVDTGIGWPICQFTLSAGGVVSNLVNLASLRSPVSYATPASPAPSPSRFVRVNASGQLVQTVANESPIGVSQNLNPGYYGVQTQLLELGGTVAAGDTLGSDASGRGVSTATFKPVVALTSGVLGSRIPVAFLSVSNGGGGGATTFTGLSDTPANYTGAGNRFVKVNGAATALEFVAGSFAPLDSPAFTGNPTAPTPLTADNDTSIATTAFVKSQNYAPLVSPALTGTPTAPSPANTAAAYALGSDVILTRSASSLLKRPVVIYGEQNTFPFANTGYRGWNAANFAHTAASSGLGAVTSATGAWVCPNTGVWQLNWSISVFNSVAGRNLIGFGLASLFAGSPSELPVADTQIPVNTDTDITTQSSYETVQNFLTLTAGVSYRPGIRSLNFTNGGLQRAQCLFTAQFLG